MKAKETFNVVTSNRSEYLYMRETCAELGLKAPSIQRGIINFPYVFCITKGEYLVGWTDRLDRNITYTSFWDFISHMNMNKTGD